MIPYTIMPYSEYARLEPLAFQLLYVIENKKLPLSEEINKKGNLIKVLYENKN